MHNNSSIVAKCVHYMIQLKIFLMTSKMNMQRMTPKSEDASRQQIRQLTISTTLTITTDAQAICKISQ